MAELPLMVLPFTSRKLPLRINVQSLSAMKVRLSPQTAAAASVTPPIALPPVVNVPAVVILIRAALLAAIYLPDNSVTLPAEEIVKPLFVTAPGVPVCTNDLTEIFAPTADVPLLLSVTTSSAAVGTVVTSVPPDVNAQVAASLHAPPAARIYLVAISPHLPTLLW